MKKISSIYTSMALFLVMALLLAACGGAAAPAAPAAQEAAPAAEAAGSEVASKALAEMEGKVFSTVIELLVTDNTVLHEDVYVVPFLFKIGTVFLKHVSEFIRNLLRNVLTYFLYVGVALKIAA